MFARSRLKSTASRSCVLYVSQSIDNHLVE